MVQHEGDQPPNYTFLARVTAGDPMRLAPALEKLVREADPGLRLRNPQTYSAVVDRSIVTERIMAALGGFFGVLALIVACLGMFSVMAFQVSRRINELGLRMALGALPAQVLGLVLRQAMVLSFIGVGIGVVSSFAVTPLLAGFLYGVKAHDILTVVLVSLLLMAVTFVASYVPARQATKIDPMRTLRHE